MANELAGIVAATNVPGGKLVLERIFDAPRELVFKVWTDPKHVARWWGPKGFTSPVCEMDLRPGGSILIHMLGPDGNVYKSRGVFHEIIEPERLVFSTRVLENEDGSSDLEVLHTVVFFEHNGKTKLTLQAVVVRSAPEAVTLLDGMKQGWSEGLDKLSDYLNQFNRRTNMGKVISKDGTAIAFDQSGKGPAVILVASALSDRLDTMQLAALLEKHFTVYNYDRRGRGDSGDTTPYAVEHEIEDIEALIDKAGGSAFLFGHSSGAVLALEAASKLSSKVKKLAMYEPPFVVDDSRPQVPADYAKRVAGLVAAGRRGDAVEYFMTEAVGVPAEFVSQMKEAPMWAAMEKTAHTLAYDGAIMGDTQSGKPLPAKRWVSATAPTLVMDGGESPAWLHNAAQAVANLLPNAHFRTLEGQDHSVAVTSPEALAPVLVEFFQV